MPVKHIVIVLVIWTLNSLRINGQDIHYSQYFYNYPSQSPVQTGLFNGDHRITANYRNQWQTVPVPYLTYSLFYDSKVKFKASKNYIGLGIGLDYDQAGDSELSLASLNVSANYGFNLSKSSLLIIGLSPNVAQRRLSNDKLQWNNQWNGEKYVSSLSPKEDYKLTGSFYLDLAGGLAYQYTSSNRTKILLGGALFHLLEPNQTFYGKSNTKAKLPMRQVLHGNINLGIGDYVDLMLNGEYQKQDVYNEKLGTGMVRLYLNTNPGVKFNLLLGCGVRLDDAFFPTIGFELKDWMVSGSYDINTSDFKTATNRRGGPEIAIQYVFRSVEPIGIFRKCPIY